MSCAQQSRCSWHQIHLYKTERQGLYLDSVTTFYSEFYDRWAIWSAGLCGGKQRHPFRAPEAFEHGLCNSDARVDMVSLAASLRQVDRTIISTIGTSTHVAQMHVFINFGHLQPPAREGEEGSLLAEARLKNTLHEWHQSQEAESCALTSHRPLHRANYTQRFLRGQANQRLRVLPRQGRASLSWLILCL